MLLKLTEKSIAALEPPTEVAQAYYWDTDDTGFGLVVGRTGVRTFVVRAPVRGQKVKITIGKAAPGPWTVQRARTRAKALLGEMAEGNNPQPSHAGITLRAALELHLGEMRDTKKAPISIKALERVVTRLLPRELDRPLAELTVEAVQLIKERYRETRTQANRLLAHISAIWNTTRRLRRTTFTAESPVGRFGVSKYVLSGEHAPEQPSVLEDDLPEWHRRVQLLANPIRRDLQMLALFTGMRDGNVLGLRWEVIDWKRGGFVIPMSKTTPFTIPFSPTVRKILEHRRAENPIAFPGGDGGWVFPSRSRRTKQVIALPETKERHVDTIAPPWRKHGPERGPYTPTGKEVLFLPGLHALRRTFLSVADHAEIGVPRHVQMLLSNHSFTGRTVHEEYLRTEWSSLVRWVGMIDDALWKRLRRRTRRGRAGPGTHSDLGAMVRSSTKP